MELQEKLKQEAVKLGLCEQWTNEWGNPDQDELCEKFVRGLDFCIKHNWPDVEFIKNNFDLDLIERHGIYVRDGAAINKKYVVVLGDAIVDVVMLEPIPCDITVLHNATVNIRLHNDRLCYITAKNNCHIHIDYKNPNGRLCMSYFGGEVFGKEYFDKITVKEQ